MSRFVTMDLESIKYFVKNNIVQCTIVIADIFLFCVAIAWGNGGRLANNKIDTLQIQERKIKTNLDKLANVEKDLATLQDLERDILKKCVNFAKKTSVYKILNQINDFLPNTDLKITNTGSYDVTKNRIIGLDQDLSAFEGDIIIATYTLSFRANFEEFIEFVKNIKTLKCFIDLQQINLQQQNSENTQMVIVSLDYRILGKIKIKELNV